MRHVLNSPLFQHSGIQYYYTISQFFFLLHLMTHRWRISRIEWMKTNQAVIFPNVWPLWVLAQRGAGEVINYFLSLSNGIKAWALDLILPLFRCTHYRGTQKHPLSFIRWADTKECSFPKRVPGKTLNQWYPDLFKDLKKTILQHSLLAEAVSVSRASTGTIPQGRKYIARTPVFTNCPNK